MTFFFILSKKVSFSLFFSNSFSKFVTNLVGVILLFGTILIVKYRGKPTEQEKNEKNNKQKEYILSKIKIMQDIKRQKSQDLITNLPKWETDEDIFNRKIYR